MRNEPPHILITNYTMLEYLLLRPIDEFFFDNAETNCARDAISTELMHFPTATETIPTEIASITNVSVIIPEVSFNLAVSV